MLEKLLHGLLAFGKFAAIVERRGYGREVVKALLDRDAKDKSFFSNREELDRLAEALTTPARTVLVKPDEEHNLYALAVEDRTNGYTRHYTLDVDFVTTGEYRTLHGAYQDVKAIDGPSIVMVTAQGTNGDSEPPAPTAAASDTNIGGAPLDRTTKLAAEPKDHAPGGGQAPKEGEVRMESAEDLLEHFIAIGKRGVAINRYKGLGEMNPEQLWATTMRPDTRTLLQVRAEDHTEADLMFTTLMGDQVEPRRKFIEDNALEVRNLDI
ncbi:MAG: hypothetical protein EHM13_12650 [Acidobacteria bacterium]|nr:MAG: hypothetical protein EHM13_12650 [Acidobacteriota bacterium]